MALHKLKRLFFFALHFPFAPSHNLLFAKEYGCSFDLRSKSLRCNTGTSHRFKAFSPPFCTKSRFRLVPPENFAKIFFDRALNRPRESRGSQTSGVLLVLFVQAKRIKSVPFGKVRGSANLEAAYPNNNFPLTKLKPFPKGDSRFCKPRISAPKTTTSHKPN